MTGWIIIKNTDNIQPLEKYSLRRLYETAISEGIAIQILSPNQFNTIVSINQEKRTFLGKEPVLPPDFLLSRMGSGIQYNGLSLLRHMQSLGIPVFNKPDSIEKVKDKLHSAQILLKAGLPFPCTMLVTKQMDINFVQEKIGFPLVLKTISGSKGSGVILCHSKEQLADFISFMNESHNDTGFILQQFIADSHGRDIRVFVVGDKVLAAMQRTASDGSFKANYSRGGKTQAYPLTQTIIDLSMKIKSIFQLDICGIDLLFNKDEYMICEVNSCPGFEGLESCTNVNVAEEIIHYIKDKIK